MSAATITTQAIHEIRNGAGTGTSDDTTIPAVPLCEDCVDCFPLGGVDFTWRPAGVGEACGADDHDRHDDGPHAVVAHPPCGPWGRFWWNYKGGEGEKDCGLRAVEQVRSFGGVLEHPSHSGLWEVAGMPCPGEGVDHHGGRTIEVRQCDWGHPAAKPTWIYSVGIEVWPTMPPPSDPTHVMVRLARNGNDRPEVPKRMRHLTPPRFAEWLVDAVRGIDRSLRGQ